MLGLTTLLAAAIIATPNAGEDLARAIASTATTTEARPAAADIEAAVLAAEQQLIAASGQSAAVTKTALERALIVCRPAELPGNQRSVASREAPAPAYACPTSAQSYAAIRVLLATVTRLANEQAVAAGAPGPAPMAAPPSAAPGGGGPDYIAP